MNNYEALKAYVVQLTGDTTEARNIIELAISDAIELKLGPDNIPPFLFVTIRNRCLDYNRHRALPEVQAAALGVAVGCLQQELRALREGRLFY